MKIYKEEKFRIGFLLETKELTNTTIYDGKEYITKQMYIVPEDNRIPMSIWGMKLDTPIFYLSK